MRRAWLCVVLGIGAQSASGGPVNISSIPVGPVPANAREVQFDVNALSAQASGAFSESFTGTLHVFNSSANPDLNGNARILDVLVDGAAQLTGGANAASFFFDLSISFLSGDITGGTLSMGVDQGGSENSYAASLSAGSGGSILSIGGGTFIIGGLTFDGTFSDPTGTFLGVDISNWGSRQPLPGRFSEIAFNPDSHGTDRDTDVDVFVAIPLPGAAAMGAIGVGGLVGLRRRR